MSAPQSEREAEPPAERTVNHPQSVREAEGSQGREPPAERAGKPAVYEPICALMRG